MKSGARVRELLTELAGEGRLILLEVEELFRLHEAGQKFDEVELKARLQEVRRVREALYALGVRHKAALEDNSAEELRKVFF